MCTMCRKPHLLETYWTGSEDLFCRFAVLIVVFHSGVEYHLRELADLCVPHLVVHSVDGEGPQEVFNDHLSVHGVLRELAHYPAIHLEL